MVTVNRQYSIKHSKHYKALSQAWAREESDVITDIYDRIHLSRSEKETIDNRAIELVTNVRRERLNTSGLDAFMVQYDLSSEEGIVLMCLAEALLRVPDSTTADRLIKDKLTSANWEVHLGTSDSFFVNAATWSLMLTGRILTPQKRKKRHLSNVMKGFLDKRSRPIVRRAAHQAMKILGQQYVMGETINKALKRAKAQEKKGYTYSYDMLGEAARTMKDAEFYFKSYYDSIVAIGKYAKNNNVRSNPGISVKLSALHPRYEIAQSQRVHQEMYPKLLELMELAKQYNIGLNIDAEESERLEISLEIIERIAQEPSLQDWDGIGVVVQAYQKRAYHVLEYLIDLAHRANRRFMIRLVKGAYWDSEIKHAQELGIEAYPVFTQKCHTDMSYQACAKLIFDNVDAIYPQFATHNALTVSTIIEYAGDYSDYEFQCLHGMGDALYDHIVGKEIYGNIPCRIYAPVGTYKHLLPYLVRRLLENGANSSFVNRIVDEQVPIEQLIENPADKAYRLGLKQHPKIPLPPYIYGESRLNSQGININDQHTLETLSANSEKYLVEPIHAYPLVETKAEIKGKVIDVYNPADHNEKVGTVQLANEKSIDVSMTNASKAFDQWNNTPAGKRAEIIEKTAHLLEEHFAEFIQIAIKEAGKTLSNAIDEVREAVDFCRYYAAQTRAEFAEPTILPGPTGEHDQISLHGRGVMVCISPWNFPLAIFLGQVTASLLAGNCVIAKPAEQTSLIAFRAVQMLHQAGVPNDVIQYLPGKGETIGAGLINDPRLAGVLFTGSTAVARLIQKTLANKPGPITPLIAETGGQNCLVVDSSALPEQVVNDVIKSSFDSAGQRCSALRVLFLQEDTADIIIDMLKGAMKELQLGNPNDLSTDIGPVIDQEAKDNLDGHLKDLEKNATIIHQVNSKEAKKGTFVLPTAAEIPNLSSLKEEFFGPILHIIRYKAKDLTTLPDLINSTGYGLTFGIHSRIEETVDYFIKNIKAGNIYVNRNIVGAIVGVQPFGGRGLSGTGPKAGGPQYLRRLATEKSVSIDTTASGGNASLMTLSET